MANTENTSYWLSPYLQPQSPIAVLKPAKKKKVARSGHTTGSVSFPVDFFEHCYQTNDLEFGGNDLLQLYNTQQIKHRLTAIGMYVASTKVGTSVICCLIKLKCYSEQCVQHLNEYCFIKNRVISLYTTGCFMTSEFSTSNALKFIIK